MFVVPIDRCCVIRARSPCRRVVLKYLHRWQLRVLTVHIKDGATDLLSLINEGRR